MPPRPSPIATTASAPPALAQPARGVADRVQPRLEPARVADRADAVTDARQRQPQRLVSGDRQPPRPLAHDPVGADLIPAERRAEQDCRLTLVAGRRLVNDERLLPAVGEIERAGGRWVHAVLARAGQSASCASTGSGQSPTVSPWALNSASVTRSSPNAMQPVWASSPPEVRMS